MVRLISAHFPGRAVQLLFLELRLGNLRKEHFEAAFAGKVLELNHGVFRGDR